MVTPVGPNPGRGRGPYEPQLYYVQTFVGPTPDQSKIFRPIWRSLPESQTIDWYRGGENLKRWEWSYNPNLIGKDRLPAGEQIYDLVPRPFEPPFVQPRTWTWQYNVNLIGKDRLPVGEQFYDLVPRPPPPLLQTWLWSTTALTLPPTADTTKIFRGPLYSQFIPPTLFQTWIAQRNLDLLAPFIFPFSQDDWPLPTQPSRIDQTWTWAYNKNLVGKDQLPIGAELSDLPPRDPRELRAWAWSYNLNLIGQDRFPTGQHLYDVHDVPSPGADPAARRSWEWSYNWKLIGKDQLPIGEQIYVLAPSQVAPEQTQLHTWQWSYNLNLIGQDRFPAGEQTTDLWPRPYQQPAQSWTWNYNLNLVGQDQLPTGEQAYILPPQPDYQVQLRTWSWSSTFYYIAVAKPFAQYDWQLTPAPRPIDQTVAASYNQNLIAQDRMVTGEQIYDLAPSQRPPEQTQLHGWAWTYNPNLVGKDRFPIRQQDWPLPQPVTWYQTWAIFQLGELELEVPFRQLDWPLTPAPLRIDETFTARYNLNLIGKDQLPTGEQTSDLPPRDPREVRTWQWTYNINLVGQDKLPTGEQIFDLAPRAYQQPAQTWTWSYNLNLVAQDRMVTGEQVTDLPPRDFARLFQTWIQNTNLALLTAPPNIFGQARQQDWPVPRGAEPDWRRSWEWSYNRNLIAQDQLPFRQSDWPNPVAPAQVKDWIQATNIALLAPSKPFAQYDWPISLGAAQPVQILVAAFNKNLIGQDQLPTGARVYDLWPAGPQQPDRGFSASFNRNLVGQDRLPNRQQDWPLNFGPLQPDNRFVGVSYNKNLVGQDRLPPGANFYNRLDLGPAPLLQQAIYEYNLAFIQVTPPPVSAAVYAKTFLAPTGFLEHIPGGNPPS